MQTILIIIVLLLFFKWFFNDNNIYKTYMIVGKKGAGKSTDIAKRSIYYQKRGFKVYSNIDIPGNHIFNPNDMSTCKFEPGSVIFLDEVGLLYDARNFRNFPTGLNQLYKYFRKYENIVYLYSQAWGSDLDLKIKNLVDEIIIMHRIGKISLLRPVAKVLDITNKEGEGGNIIFSFKYKGVFSWRFNYLPRYYGLFESFDPPYRPLIDSTIKEYNELNTIYYNTISWIIYSIKTGLYKLYLAIKSKSPFSKKKYNDIQ